MRGVFAFLILLAGLVVLRLYLSPQRAGAARTAAETFPTTGPTTQETQMNYQVAEFGSGCFWGTEATFRKVPGVVDVAVGYEGGALENPSYEDVCTDRTGHAEVVRITYDPAKVGYDKLLNVFFENHDPTTLDRQGPDFGSQYRSVVFYHTPEQKQAAEAEKDRRNKSGEYVNPIVTAIEPAKTFYRAEEYHQRYFEKQGVNYTCHLGNGKKRQPR